MRKILYSLLFLTTTLAIAPTPAKAWGCEGHQIIALLARVHLTPVATNAIDQLLRDNPVEVNSQYCKGAGDLMANVASWADNVRNAERTGLWHYIDIPLAEHRGPVSKWCDSVDEAPVGAPAKDRTGCVLTAIEFEVKILADPAKSSAERAAALRYIIHFIGDMHQPLHSADNNDRGGNCTTLQFFADERPANLHSIWDTRMIVRHLTEAKLNPAQYATAIDAEFAPAWKQISQGTPTDWAWDGHNVAERVTYGALKPAIPVETPDPDHPGITNDEGCNAERAKVTALHIAIGDDYYKQALPATERQLAKGGYRLAAFLNAAFVK